MAAIVNRCMRLSVVALFLALFLLTGSNASAQVLIYSDVTTYTGFAYANGGAASLGGNGSTTLVADELSLTPGYGGLPVDGFSFSVASFNAAPVSARPLVRFYSDSGPSGGPGAILGEFNFSAVTFPASTLQIYSFNAANLFTIPADDTIWAAIAFDNNGGTTGATLAQLNDLGQGIFNPPTVGSSGDFFFQSSTAGSFISDNPTGGFFNFGGNPVANFAWALQAPPLPSVPEPANIALLSAFALTGALGTMRLKKRMLNRA